MTATNFTQIYSKLKGFGTAQNVKVYRRHGAGNKLFGVSIANQKKLKKMIKTDHTLAQKLWSTGNEDARILGALVADPEKLTLKEAESWLKDVHFYLVSNYLAILVSQTPFATKASAKWRKSKKEYFLHCGYDVLATLLKNGEVFEKTELEKILTEIEKKIHAAPNRGRSAMNGALIAIGTYGKGLKGAAIASSKRIGPVMVDHGDTSCKTPDATSYIRKAHAHRAKRR